VLATRAVTCARVNLVAAAAAFPTAKFCIEFDLQILDPCSLKIAEAS
jgi:hypothetical protein